MLLHTGTSWGYGGLVTLLPDSQIGIYSSITGSDRGYHGRRLLHIYIMDLLLGVTPWLNLTTACTFPRKTTTSRGQYTNDVTAFKCALPLSSYEGVYGNFAYGNVSVYINRTTNDLRIRYGVLGFWRLHCDTEGENLFFVQQAGYMIYDMGLARFVIEKGVPRTLVIPGFDWKYPPTFERGLRMSDAPSFSLNRQGKVSCLVASDAERFGACLVLIVSVLLSFASI